MVKHIFVLVLTLILLQSCVKGPSILDEPPPPPPPPPPAPVADFTSTINQNKVVFSNNSKYADSYIWDFADKSSSTEENPTHSYQNGGFYQVKLIAKGPSGIDSIEKFIKVLNPISRCLLQVVQLESHTIGTTLDQGSYPDIYIVITSSSGISYTSRDSYYLNTAPTVKKWWQFTQPPITCKPLDQNIKITFWDYDEVEKGDVDDLIESFIFNPSDYSKGANPFPSKVSFQGKLVNFSLDLTWD